MQQEHHPVAPPEDIHRQGDHPAIHGMLIIGEARVLMSHLPMFHSPHDFQVLLEVSLSMAGAAPSKTYLDDRRDTMSKVYTWVPKPFVLSTLVADPTMQPTMIGTIYRGHFERGGVAITSDQVEARVGRVLYARRLDPKAPAPTELRYLMFGSPAELFLAHLITKPPDFDQVLVAQVEIPLDGWLGGLDGTAIALRIEGSGHAPNVPLKEGDRFRATRLDSPVIDAHPLAVSTEFYFETGDLAS